MRESNKKSPYAGVICEGDDGFTLVELMIAVAIVGVLATLAVVGYRRLITGAHTTEATHMVGAIRAAQESYHAETGSYADISKSLNVPDLYPLGTTPATPTKTAWGGACGTCTKAWSTLPVHVDGPVLFGYATRAGAAGSTAAVSIPNNNAGASWVTIPATSSTDWYVISAIGDSDGILARKCTVIGSSWTNDLFIDGDGE